MPPPGHQPDSWSVTDRKHRTMGWWSLGLSIVPGVWTIVGVVLASIVLAEGRRGRKHAGRGPSIAAFCLMAAWGVGIVIGVAVDASSDDVADDSRAVTRTENVRLEDLRVGDCLDVPTRDEFSFVTRMPCSTAHHGEVYVEFDLPAGKYPGDDVVIARAEQGCADRFEAFVGVPYEESPLEVVYAWPLGSSWSIDRSVLCVVHDPDRTTTSTLRATGRSGRPA